MPEVDEASQAEPARARKAEHEHEDSEMSGINESLDKININMPGADGGGGNAALLAAMMANKNNDGLNNLWPLLLLARGRGGLGGDDGGDGINPILFNQITQTLGDIKGAIPTAAASTENVILQQTNALNSSLASLGLGVQAGFANLGDKVTNSATTVLAAGQANTNQILLAIQGVKDQATQFEMSTLQRQLAVADSALLDERHRGRSRDVEVNVSQQVNQQQAQGQLQAQLQSQGNVLSSLFQLLAENTQLSRAAAANTNYIVGNTGASTTGAQTATPTSTNLRT